MLSQNLISESAASSSLTLVSTCSEEKDVTASSARSSLTLVSEEIKNTVTFSATNSSLDLKPIEKRVDRPGKSGDRVDRGRNAWLFLLSAFLVEGLLFGIFPAYYLYLRS